MVVPGLRVLGIDPGSRITGYGIVEHAGSRLRYVTSGCIRTSRAGPYQRLAEIHAGVMALIDEFHPREVAVEQVFVARNPASALMLGQARGVALAAAVASQLPIADYATRRVKQAVTGAGGATKAQIQHMVARLLNLNDAPGSDAADALAIAICHINTRGSLLTRSGVGQ
jgi:crossover junction endodeoxyribonuclease RuvC